MDLTTSYLGLSLKNPIVPSASPLSEEVSRIRAMEDAGAGAVVMHSLFEEQIMGEGHRLDHFLSYGSESFAEALSYFPEAAEYNVGPEEYLDNIRQAKEAVDIPVIGSLNGVSFGGWTEYASLIEEAGADAIELNVYYLATDPRRTSYDVEEMYLNVLREVRTRVQIPVAVKLSPFFSAMANMALRLEDAGADGLVLFNRFYQPDFDLESLDVVPHLVLSKSDEMRLPLRWIAILFGRVDVDLALTTGVHNHFDVLKGLMAGANVTMLASELLRNGIGRVGEILHDLARWMVEHEYASVAQLRGSMSQKNIREGAAFERANYMKVLQSWHADPTGQFIA